MQHLKNLYLHTSIVINYNKSDILDSLSTKCKISIAVQAIFGNFWTISNYTEKKEEFRFDKPIAKLSLTGNREQGIVKSLQDFLVRIDFFQFPKKSSYILLFIQQNIYS